MAQQAAVLPIIIEAVDRTSKQLSAIEQRVVGLERTVNRSSRNISKGGERMGAAATVGATRFATGLAGVGIAAAAAAFQSGKFNLLIAQAGVASRASAKEVELLRVTALRGAKGLSVLPVEAAFTARELSKLGLNAQQVADSLVPTLKLMTASFQQLGPSQAGRLIAQSLKIFNLEGTEASRVARVLTAAALGSALEFNKLSLGIAITATGSKALNSSFEDTVAVTALIANIFPQRINRGVRAAARLFEDLAETQKRQRFETVFGIKVANEQTGQFRDTTDIIGDFVKVLIPLTPVQRAAKIEMVKFSIEAKRALQDFTVLSEVGIQNFNKRLVTGERVFGAFSDRLREEGRAGGSLDQSTVVFRESLPGAIKESVAAFQLLGITIGTEVQATLIPILDGLTVVVNGLADGLERLPEPLKKVGGGLAALAAIFFGARIAKRGVRFLFGGRLTGAALGGLAAGGAVGRLGRRGGARVAGGAAAAGAVAGGGFAAFRKRGLLARGLGAAGRFGTGTLIPALILESLLDSLFAEETRGERLGRGITGQPSLGELRGFSSELQATEAALRSELAQANRAFGTDFPIPVAPAPPRVAPPAGAPIDPSLIPPVASDGGGGGGEVMLQPVEIVLDMERVGRAVLRFQRDRAVRSFDRFKMI